LYERREHDVNGNFNRGQFERYRLMLISTWAESELKRAALASARAALERELGAPGLDADARVVLKAAA
jgi:hypothetical protein